MEHDFDINDTKQVACELIYNFYSWIIQVAKEDCNIIKDNKYKEFYDEYAQIIKNLIEKRKTINSNHEVDNINIDSIEILKIIVEATKEEYKAIKDTNIKNIIYFNNLLGWYEEIPLEMDMFTNSLLIKQL